MAPMSQAAATRFWSWLHNTIHGVAEDWRDETGQTTAEYALVLLGVAAIAMLVLAWAGQTDRINGLFDAVLDSITGLVP